MPYELSYRLVITPRYVSQRYARSGYSYLHYNDPWFRSGNEVLARRDFTPMFRRYYRYGEPFSGTAAKKLPRGSGTARGTEPVVSSEEHPEAGWINKRPPRKDKNGIPIPDLKRGGLALYELDRLAKNGPGVPMKINGRWHVWDRNEQRWVPAKLVRREVNRVPVDTKLKHGPLLPTGRQEAHSLVDRIRTTQGPVLSIEIADATETQANDLIDLLEAISQ